MKYLLDTCVFSEFVKPAFNEAVMEFISEQDESLLFISSMTLGELHKGIQDLANSKKKTNLFIWIGAIEEQFEGRVLPFDNECAIEWAQLCSDTEKKGKKMAAFDSIIAAVARKNNLCLVTRNVKDFQHSGLEFLNPWL